MLLKEISARKFRLRSFASTSAQSLLFQKQNFILTRTTRVIGPFLDSLIPFGMPKMEENSTFLKKRLSMKREDSLFSLLRLSMTVDMSSMRRFRIGVLQYFYSAYFSVARDAKLIWYYS